MKETVVFSSNTCWSIYNFRMGLIRALKKEDYRVITVAPEDEYSKLIEKETPIYLIKNLERKGKNPVKDLMLIYEYVKFYRKINPDIVINFSIKPNIYSSIACGILGIKTVSVVTGLGYAYVKGGILERITNTLYKIAFRFNKRVVFLNEDDMKFFINKSILNPPKAYLIKSEGVNTTFFSSEVCSERKRDKIIFLMICRLLWDKGINEFVESARMVKEKYDNAEFWLLGSFDEGNPSAVSEEKIREWQEKGWIIYHGSTNDVRQYICMADAVILPSYREGTPRVLLEAMAMEKPIITTDTVGCRDVCEDGVNGFLIPPRNAKALSEAVIKFITLSETEKSEMGRSGRIKVLKEFDESVVVDKYLKLIREVLH